MNKKNFTSISLISLVVLFLSITIPKIQSISYAEEEKFGGVGVSIAQIFDPDVENKIGSLVVLDVIKGNAASKHGIQRGDVITHIDGEPTKSKMFKYIIFEKMRGKTGSKVNLLIKRAGEKNPLNITLTRQEITYSPEKTK